MRLYPKDNHRNNKSNKRCNTFRYLFCLFCLTITPVYDGYSPITNGQVHTTNVPKVMQPFKITLIMNTQRIKPMFWSVNVSLYVSSWRIKPCGRFNIPGPPRIDFAISLRPYIYIFLTVIICMFSQQFHIMPGIQCLKCCILWHFCGQSVVAVDYYAANLKQITIVIIKHVCRKKVGRYQAYRFQTCAKAN